MMESTRNRKVLQQDEKTSLKKWDFLKEALGLSGPLDLLTNDLLRCTVLLISFSGQMRSKSSFLDGQSLCDVKSADFLRLCF